MLQRLAAFLRRPAAAPLAAAVRCVSSGSVEITVPLNFWAGKRRTSQEKCNKENVYEPATGMSHNSLEIRKYFLSLVTLFLNWTLLTAVWRLIVWWHVARHFFFFFLHFPEYFILVCKDCVVHLIIIFPKTITCAHIQFFCNTLSDMQTHIIAISGPRQASVEQSQVMTTSLQL